MVFATEGGSPKSSFNADLVTLISYEIDLDKLSRDEGLIGLTRAFIYAIAPSVLVSSCVDESTAALMKIFYKFLMERMNKAEALRQAKLKLIRIREHGM
jgi:CHAT domain-containing protein